MSKQPPPPPREPFVEKNWPKANTGHGRKHKRIGPPPGGHRIGTHPRAFDPQYSCYTSGGRKGKWPNRWDNYPGPGPSPAMLARELVDFVNKIRLELGQPRFTYTGNIAVSDRKWIEPRPNMRDRDEHWRHGHAFVHGCDSCHSIEWRKKQITRNRETLKMYKAEGACFNCFRRGGGENAVPLCMTPKVPTADIQIQDYMHYGEDNFEDVMKSLFRLACQRCRRHGNRHQRYTATTGYGDKMFKH